MSGSVAKASLKDLGKQSSCGAPCSQACDEAIALSASSALEQCGHPASFLTV